jgi:hypothetical protein
MRWRFRQNGDSMMVWLTFITKRHVLMGALALALLVVLAACQPGNASGTAQTSATATPGSASARNHVPAGERPQFARITFTTSTSYDQARALLASVGQTPFPWACSDLYFGTPTPTVGMYRVLPGTTPPPSAEQDTPAAYAASHQFLVAFPTSQQLSQIAASDEVAAIDPLRLPPCL